MTADWRWPLFLLPLLAAGCAGPDAAPAESVSGPAEKTFFTGWDGRVAERPDAADLQGIAAPTKAVRWTAGNYTGAAALEIHFQVAKPCNCTANVNATGKSQGSAPDFYMRVGTDRGWYEARDSSGELAQAHLASGLDTRSDDDGGGSWGRGTGVRLPVMENLTLRVLVRDAIPPFTDFYDGSLEFGVRCEEPFRVTRLAAGTQAELFDSSTARGGDGASALGAGTSSGDRVERDLSGADNLVMAFASLARGSVRIETPNATEDWTFTEGAWESWSPPGRHAVMFDATFASPIWFAMAAFDPVDHWGSLRDLFPPDASA